MTITLTHNATVVTLQDDLVWPDEFTWRAVEQKKQYSVTGALLVESALKRTGRTIELRSADRTGWLLRSVVVALYALAQIPGAVMVLVLRGQTFNVLFDFEAGAIEAQPIDGEDYSDPIDADRYLVTLRFITQP